MPNEQTTVPLFTAGEVLTAADMNLSAGTGVPVFATTVTRDAGFGGAGEKVLAEGQLCYLSDSNIVQYYDGAAWATVGPAATSTAIFNETQASNTNSGTSVANAWTKRILNTTNVNTITGCSIASSVITLAAGTYLITATSPHWQSNQVKIRLQNTTDSTTAIIGTSTYFATTSGTSSTTNLNGQFTITASKNFELQYYVKNAFTDEGLGIKSNITSISEVYAIIQIQKVG
jgi:hypothetical protein